MDTLKSFLISECFNGEKYVQESSQLQLTCLNGLVVEYKVLEKKLGFESQQLFFFLWEKMDKR